MLKGVKLARLKEVRVSGLNITNEHESAKAYYEAIYLAYENRLIHTYQGDHALVITSLPKRSNDELPTDIYGVFARYTQIDVNGDWLNTESLELATPNDKKSIQIPANLKPNVSAFYFRFNLHQHKLIFEVYSTQGKTLSQSKAKDFFLDILNQPSVRKEWGAFNVNIISSDESLKTILDVHRIQYIITEIERPNGDGVGSALERAEKNHKERLQAIKAQRQKIEYKALPGQSLKPDDQLKTEIYIASNNGNATVIGRDKEGKKVEKSLDEYPRVEGVKYDTELRLGRQAFDEATDEFL